MHDYACMTDRLSATRASEIPLWQEDLPHAKLLPAKHRMCSAVPKVEVTHQAHRMRTWRPDCKAGSPQSWKEKSLEDSLFPYVSIFSMLLFPWNSMEFSPPHVECGQPTIVTTSIYIAHS